MTSIVGVIKRFWVVLVVSLAVVVAILVVTRLRGFFGSDLPASAGGGGADSIVAFNAKTVTYEIVGPQNASGAASYLDVDGTTHEEHFTTLPWSVTITTTNPSMFADVVAQADGTTLGCRILVDGTLTAEQHASGRDAQVFCLDKAA